MKKMYLCILLVSFACILSAQNDCQGYDSDEMYLRYTASGYQEVVRGNHSKAINESRKIANIIAESELAKMVNSMVTRVTDQMMLESGDYSDLHIDTMLVSSYKVFKGMRTVCQSETKLIDNFYVTYITKEISLEDISDILYEENEKRKQKYKEIINK